MGLPAHVIESFVRHCFSALAGIRRARDLADSAANSALLIGSMVEGIAHHEIILDAGASIIGPAAAPDVAIELDGVVIGAFTVQGSAATPIEPKVAFNRQIAFPAEAPQPLANLHVSLLQAFGIQGAFGKNGAIFGDHGTAPIDGILV